MQISEIFNQISIIFIKKRCGPNPALAQTVSMPRSPLWHVLPHVPPLRTRGGCENATFRGASRHERRAKKIRPRGRVVSRAGSLCLVFTFQAHASSLGHVASPSRCIFEVLRDTRGPTWPKQGCKFPRFSIEISTIFIKKRCGPNPALTQTVSMPRYPL